MKKIEYTAEKVCYSTTVLYKVVITYQTHRGAGFGGWNGIDDDWGRDFKDDEFKCSFGSIRLISGYYPSTNRLLTENIICMRGLVRRFDDVPLIMNYLQFEKFESVVKAYNRYYGAEDGSK